MTFYTDTEFTSSSLSLTTGPSKDLQLDERLLTILGLS